MWRRSLFLPASSIVMLAAAAIASCVGDDPGVQSGPIDSGVDTGSSATDSGTDTATPADTGSDTGNVDAGYQPTALQSLVLWFDGDDKASIVLDTSSSTVTTWNDRGKNGLNALAPTSGSRPTYVGRVGIVPGSVRFNGSSNYLKIGDNSLLDWGTGDFLIEIVTRHTKGAAERAGLWAKGNNTGVMGILGNSQSSGAAGNLEGYLVGANPVTSVTGGFNNGLTFLVALERKNGVLAIRVNGAESASSNDPIHAATNVATGPVHLGAMIDTAGGGAGFQFLQGDIAEIVAVKDPLQPEKRAELEAYLKAKHGLP